MPTNIVEVVHTPSHRGRVKTPCFGESREWIPVNSRECYGKGGGVMESVFTVNLHHYPSRNSRMDVLPLFILQIFF